MSDPNRTARGSPQANPTCAGDGPTRKPQRFSAKMKISIVFRLLRREEFDLLSREYDTIDAKVSRWRDAFLWEDKAAMKKGEEPENEEIKHLRDKIPEVTMESELPRRAQANAAARYESPGHGKS